MDKNTSRMPAGIRTTEQLERELSRLHAENEQLSAQLQYHRQIFRDLQSALATVRVGGEGSTSPTPLDRLLRDNQRLRNQLKISKLSNRELEILQLIAKGLTSKDIAMHLTISKFTVDTHRKNLLQKLGARTTTELIHIVEPLE